MGNNETTGSTIYGTVIGLEAGFYPSVMATRGNPSGLVISAQISGIAFDIVGGSIYMSLAKASSDWIALGSVAY